MAESRAIPDGADRRARAIVRDPTIADRAVTVVEVDDPSELRVGSRLLMVAAQQDARVVDPVRYLGQASPVVLSFVPVIPLARCGAATRPG